MMKLADVDNTLVSIKYEDRDSQIRCIKYDNQIFISLMEFLMLVYNTNKNHAVRHIWPRLKKSWSTIQEQVLRIQDSQMDRHGTPYFPLEKIDLLARSLKGAAGDKFRAWAKKNITFTTNEKPPIQGGLQELLNGYSSDDDDVFQTELTAIQDQDHRIQQLSIKNKDLEDQVKLYREQSMEQQPSSESHLVWIMKPIGKCQPVSPASAPKK